MKNLLLLIGLLAICFHLSWSQSGGVGIGTSTPDNFAKLDVSDTAKGVLIPRLTTAQRNNLGASLSSAQIGLLVFDRNQNRFYFWNSLNWVAVLDAVRDDNDWDVSGVDLVSAVSGNVGIGDPTPTEKLDVSGQIQATGFLDKNNSTYFIDPSSTSNAGNFAGPVTAKSYKDQDSPIYFLDPSSPTISLLAAGEIFGSRFVDVFNNQYHVDPNSTGVAANLRGSADA